VLPGIVDKLTPKGRLPTQFDLAGDHPVPRKEIGTPINMGIAVPKASHIGASSEPLGNFSTLRTAGYDEPGKVLKPRHRPTATRWAAFQGQAVKGV
jgi:hypothetical protein